nr:MAG: hypothetical protein [Bacteriophage sp.]
MNLDTYLDAAEGCGNMKDFKRNLGMEGEKSSDVLTCILLGCVADRVKAIEHPAEFYADCARGHGGELGRKSESLSSAMRSLEEAFRG